MEARLYEEGTVPDWTQPWWYLQRDRARHVEEDLHRPRLELAASMVIEAADTYGLSTVSDLGSGDGGLLWLLKNQRPDLKTWGYDLQESNTVPAVEERGVDVRYGDIINGEIEYGDISVATELIEHLLVPNDFLTQLHANTRVVVASSPWTETAESHYPFHTWAWSVEGYRKLFERNNFEVIRHEQTGMFQVIMAKSNAPF